jgi:hypothetical protein
MILGDFKDYQSPLQLTARVNPSPLQSSSYSITHFSDEYSSPIVTSLKLVFSVRTSNVHFAYHTCPSHVLDLLAPLILLNTNFCSRNFAQMLK